VKDERLNLHHMLDWKSIRGVRDILIHVWPDGAGAVTVQPAGVEGSTLAMMR
jgi:uncharacterized protein with HEPN domain